MKRLAGLLALCALSCTASPRRPPEYALPGPAWVPDLILYQLRLDTFAPGTPDASVLRNAAAKLDYLADLGVTGVLLNPIAEFNKIGRDGAPVKPETYNFYGVSLHDRIDPVLGTADDFRAFVRRAHALGIRVILDVVPHGVSFRSPMLTEHPDWFKRDKDGKICGTWGMADFDWKIPEVRRWWIDLMVRTWVLSFDIDGFRCDVEPDVSGYEIWKAVREEAQAADREILVIAELLWPRKGVFHMTQEDFAVRNPQLAGHDFMRDASMVDTVASLDEPYYMSELSIHDRIGYSAQGRPVFFGYPMLFSPFVPLWRMGEEFDAPNLMPLSRRFAPIFTTESPAQPVRLLPGHALGQDFQMPADSRGLRIKAFAAQKDAANRLRLSLYRSAPNFVYGETTAQAPLAQQTFTGFGDGDWLLLPLDGLVPGHCLWVADDAAGDVGVWGAETTFPGTFFADGQAQPSKDLFTELDAPHGRPLYFNPLDWSALERNAGFFRKVKRMIQVRREWRHVFAPFTPRVKDRPLARVPATGTDLEVYAASRDGVTIVVAGKLTAPGGPVTLKLSALGLQARYRVTHLLDDPPVAREVAAEALASYTFALAQGDVAAILIEPLGD